MKSIAKKMTTSLFLSSWLIMAAFSPALGQEYEALQNVKSADTVFDFEIAEPQSALLHLQLLHETYKDKAIRAVDSRPDFAVVFIGPSVKLISTNRNGFAAEDQQALDEIAATVSRMSQDGIKLEICLVAANAFNVDPPTVLPEIRKVSNGWISLIGYQAQGYSLVAAR